MGKGGYLRVWVRKKWEETNLIHSVDFPKSRSETYCYTEQNTLKMISPPPKKLSPEANNMQTHHLKECFHGKACTGFS